MRENLEPTSESYKTEHTKDSVFNRLDQPVDDPNLDDNYEFEHERSVGSRESADLHARLDAQQAQREQQAENRPPVQAMPKEECLTQMQAQIDRLLAERSILILFGRSYQRHNLHSQPAFQ